MPSRSRSAAAGDPHALSRPRVRRPRALRVCMPERLESHRYRQDDSSRGKRSWRRRVQHQGVPRGQHPGRLGPAHPLRGRRAVAGPARREDGRGAGALGAVVLRALLERVRDGRRREGGADRRRPGPGRRPHQPGPARAQGAPRLGGEPQPRPPHAPPDPPRRQAPRGELGRGDGPGRPAVQGRSATGSPPGRSGSTTAASSSSRTITRWRRSARRGSARPTWTATPGSARRPPRGPSSRRSGPTASPRSYADVDACDALLLVGHNVASQQTVLWSRILDRLAGPNPPKVVVIDPRATETAKKADVHLAPRLGHQRRRPERADAPDDRGRAGSTAPSSTPTPSGSRRSGAWSPTTRPRGSRRSPGSPRRSSGRRPRSWGRRPGWSRPSCRGSTSRTRRAPRPSRSTT